MDNYSVGCPDSPMLHRVCVRRGEMIGRDDLHTVEVIIRYTR
jgi:hypothetical protein